MTKDETIAETFCDLLLTSTLHILDYESPSHIWISVCSVCGDIRWVTMVLCWRNTLTSKNKAGVRYIL